MHQERRSWMGKRKYTQYTGEEMYQRLKRRYEGEYMGLDEVDGLREAEAEVRAYFDMVARELEEGLQ
jgi:hypothetical protein